MCSCRLYCWSGHDRPHGRPKDRVHGVNWRWEDNHEECCREQCQEGLPGVRGKSPLIIFGNCDLDKSKLLLWLINNYYRVHSLCSSTRERTA